MSIIRWEIKEEARKLRKQGLSYKEILKQIPVAKSTLSLWCKDIQLTPEQIYILGKRYDAQHKGAKANQIKRQLEIDKIRKEAFKEIKRPDKFAFMMAGAMLYWAEGNKSRSLGITNSDYNLIKFMVRWFQEIVGIPITSLRAKLNIHSGQDDIKIKKFWSEQTGISLTQFGKSYVKPEGTGFRKNVLYNGTIRIEVCNKNLLHRTLAWIDKYQEFINKRAANSIGRVPVS